MVKEESGQDLTLTAELGKRLNDLGTEMTELRSQVYDQTANIATIQATEQERHDWTQSEISSMQASISSVQSSISTLQSSINRVKTDINAIIGMIESLTNRIVALENA